MKLIVFGLLLISFLFSPLSHQYISASQDIQKEITKISNNKVDTIQYRSTKISKIAGNEVLSKYIVYYSDGNIRIDYFEPEKKTLLLSGDNVYLLYDYDNEKNEHFKWSKTPIAIKSMLKPTIFSAAEFITKMSTSNFNIEQKEVEQESFSLYIAKFKDETKKGKIEYLYNAHKGELKKYKVYGNNNQLVTEANYFDYKVFEDKYLMPKRIHVLFYSQYGLMEEEEIFSRIRINIEIDKNKFIYDKEGR
jgi:outer membrane lipoprotein-sorting protein